MELPRDAIAIAAENHLVAYIFACSVKPLLQRRLSQLLVLLRVAVLQNLLE